MRYRPMPLVRVSEPFDHDDWIYELKYDGFRALAVIDGHRCDLVSRRGYLFKCWDVLKTEISHGIRAHSAVLDGEIVCLDGDGRSNFYNLMFRRDWPFFFAFDVLSRDGEDLTSRPLLERKRRLRSMMPRIESRLQHVDHVKGRGCDLFRQVCERDLEGIVAKWTRGRYHTDGVQTSWIKIKNPTYSQAVGRREVFQRRRSPEGRLRHSSAPVLTLALPKRSRVTPQSATEIR